MAWLRLHLLELLDHLRNKSIFYSNNIFQQNLSNEAIKIGKQRNNKNVANYFSSQRRRVTFNHAFPNKNQYMRDFTRRRESASKTRRIKIVVVYRYSRRTVI